VFAGSQSLELSNVRVIACGMDVYELRTIERGFRLSGGKLNEPLVYRENEPAPAIHLVGFLSQRDGSELRVFDRNGGLIQARCFQSTIVMPGAVGGLAGPN
jgi:hypothetical protein